MVLVDCLNIRTPGFRVFAQELAEFGNIRLAEEGVKHVTSIIGAFVKALLTLLKFPFGILIGSGDAAGTDKNPFGQSCSLLHLNQSIHSGVQDDLILTCMSCHLSAIPSAQ